jgi:oxygen-independent coproporphyrinogen III oxidase
MDEKQFWTLAEAKQRELKKLEGFGIRRTNENYYVHVTNPLPYGSLEAVSLDDFLETLSDAQIEEATAYQGYYGCVNLCDFCPFGTMVDSDAPDTLSAMIKEHELWAKHIDPTITALYFGGGTASVIPPKELDKILSSIKRNFSISKEGEWKFELYPKRYGHSRLEKMLEVLQNHGFTDLNIDVQSSNQQSLDAIGRNNSSFAAYVDLVKKVEKYGFGSISTTVMVGLPHETRETFTEGLQKIVDMPEISTVIVYPIFQTANNKIHVGQQKAEGYASVEKKDTMQAFADLYLRELGFHTNVFGYYVRNKPKQLSIEQKFHGATHIGMGTSARGCFRTGDGVQHHYHSEPINHDYLKAIKEGRLPIQRVGSINQQEQGRHYFLQALCSLQPVDVSAFDSQYGTNLLADLNPTLSALTNVGVVAVDGNRVQLLEPLRSEEIIGHLRDSTVNEELLQRRYANDGRNLNWGIGIPTEDKTRLLTYA